MRRGPYFEHRSASFAWRASSFRSPTDYVLELTRSDRASFDFRKLYRDDTAAGGVPDLKMSDNEARENP